MNTINRQIVLGLFAIHALCLSVVSAQTTVVSPENSNLSYVGRFSSSHTFGWSGSSVRCRFEGTDAVAKLKTSGKKIALQVVLDGVPTQVLFVTSDKQSYVVAQNLSHGEHTLELFQRTEAYFGQTQFLGFELSANAKLRPIAKAKRRLMVLGDSITCAYGSEEADRSKGNTAENENAYMSYAPITARALDADIQMICWSGRGLYRNRGLKNDQANTIPILFDRTLPLKENPKWQMSNYAPQVVIINLGTNDLTTRNDQKPKLQKEQYLGTYKKMIQRLRKSYPEVQIFACIGPMAVEPISDWLLELEQAYPFVHRVTFPRFEGDNEIGGHWHPSNFKHKLMAEQLTPAIRSVMKW